MKKYYRFTLNEILVKFQYRFSFISSIITYMVSFLTTFFIWKAIYKSSGNVNIGGYTENQMLVYITITNFMHYIFNFNRITRLSNQVRTGKLNMLLIKPIDLIKENFFSYLGTKLINILFFVLLITILKIMGKLNNYFLILIFISLIFMMYFYLVGVISCLGFYLLKTWMLIGLFNGIYFIVSGTYFPLSLLPRVVYLIFSYTPFGIVGYGLTTTLQGIISINQILIYIFVTIIYIILFRFLYKLALKRGLKTYEGMGA